MKITKITVIMKFFTNYPLHPCLYTGATFRKILPTSGVLHPLSSSYLAQTRAAAATVYSKSAGV